MGTYVARVSCGGGVRRADRKEGENKSIPPPLNERKLSEEKPPTSEGRMKGYLIR